jgi:hypothetical protein
MQWWQTLLTVIGTIAASTGFWTWLQKRTDKKDVRTRMLIGLAHDRIIYLGMCYISRDGGGWITQEEYENLNDYLYKPYEEMGGNGSAKRIMEEVRKLPIRKVTFENTPTCKPNP